MKFGHILSWEHSIHGLKGKAPYIVSQLAYGDIWAVSETHLCAQSMQTFRSGLHFAESPYRYCVGGHPVPAQNNCMFHSAWRGVALLSKFPTRPLPHHWPQGIYESSRIQVTATLVHDTWLTGATIYGEPESAAYPQQKQNNEQLLQCAISQVCHLSKGPRFIAGDWNVLAQTLPAFDALMEAGFMDLQDIALQRWGRSISPTCKTATRKDFCYISSEMQTLLQSVHVAEDIFPDHAVMWGVFHNMAQLLPKQVWLTPKAFPWPKDWQVDPQFWNCTEGTVDQRYSALWSHIEASAKGSVPFPIPKSAMGRAKTLATKPVYEGKFTPPKKKPEQGMFNHITLLHLSDMLSGYGKPADSRHMSVLPEQVTLNLPMPVPCGVLFCVPGVFIPRSQNGGPAVSGGQLVPRCNFLLSRPCMLLRNRFLTP